MTAEVPIVVVGLMGAGKTSVSRLLSEALDRPMRDSDAYLERRYGATAAEIASREGAKLLHAREAVHLLDSLTERPAPVIAAAASVLDDPRCRAALKPALVVWLDALPGFIAERITEKSHRPRFGKEPLALASELRERRAASFAEVADLRFERPAVSKHEVARAVLDHLEVASR
ncbi:shikimate kinase [Streptosporangium sp. NBC_01639]|uniref:shikimate kinase n=1 Tax=unclassified Streptosporangium TaxID=2632669 RepID=UPI002DD80917|nr:shikimate kinase [Streptosporangium sp. NBC_01756]WSC85930.1 shikimate kinase [Streptosporangium sp. NBC_01756]WTD55397.1 shikimate kinase [Streptosporangium sp. NBC_01639]